MRPKFHTRNPVTRAQYPKFFSMCRKAALNLDLYTSEEIDEYRHKVMMEETGKASLKDLNRTGDFDACIKRFAADAGDYNQAINIDLMETLRRAYVIKVMSMQILQLKGGDDSTARDYLEAIVQQARIPCGVHTSDNSFYMDVAPSSIMKLIQILDTFRRKLLKAYFPTFPGRFDDTIRYHIDGPIHTRETGVNPNYYHLAPFKVNVTK